MAPVNCRPKYLLPCHDQQEDLVRGGGFLQLKCSGRPPNINPISLWNIQSQWWESGSKILSFGVNRELRRKTIRRGPETENGRQTWVQQEREGDIGRIILSFFGRKSTGLSPLPLPKTPSWPAARKHSKENFCLLVHRFSEFRNKLMLRYTDTCVYRIFRNSRLTLPAL